MTQLGLTLVRPGVGTAGLSVAIVSTNTAVVVFDWTESALTGRVAVLGLVLFIAGIALGSSRLVGGATIPILGAAVIGAVETDQSIWLAAGIWAVTFYAATEMAWHSLERRRHGVTDLGVTRRRIAEVATVVAVSLVLTSAALVLSSASPPRMALVQGLVVLLLITGLRSARGVLDRAFEVGSDAVERSS